MDSINGISYYLNKMLDAIKHITDGIFFFQEDSARGVATFSALGGGDKQ